VAPYQRLFDQDAAGFCSSLTPTAAAHVGVGAAPDSGCQAAVEGALAAATSGEVSPGTRSYFHGWARHVVVVGPHARAEVHFYFTRITEEPGRASARFGVARPVDVDLELLGGRWLVSSPVGLTTKPGCAFARCPMGSRVLALSLGTPIESTQLIAAPPAVRRAGDRVEREFEEGAAVVARSGCLACHLLGLSGNRGPGRALIDPRAPMPSFKKLPREKFRAIVRFLSLLR
jgi:hypothetical protein